MQFLQKHLAFCLGSAFMLLLFTASCKNPFFWDTIQLGSKQANWYYSQSFSRFFLPDHIDSGHFPLFGMLLAMFWSLLGKTLFVSHLIMIPFLLLIVHYTLEIGKIVSDDNFKKFFLILLCCNPYFLGQAILVSPDVLLLSFFLMWVYGYLTEHKLVIFIASIGLALISLRGLFLLLVLIIWACYRYFYLKKLPVKWQVMFPGIVLAGAYQLIHYLNKGWVVYHSDSPWQASFQLESQISALMRNSAIFAWRLIDFGNGFLWLAFLILLVNGKGRKSLFFSLLIMLTAAFGMLTVSRAGLLNHRYFLPIIVVLIFSTLDLLYSSRFQFKKVLIAGLCIMTISGNLWVYPMGIAQGWDSTLSHYPYYNLSEKVIEYMEEQNIDVRIVGTSFPAKNMISDVCLNDDTRSFKAFDIDNDKYILYSNVMNDFDGEHIFELDNLWLPIWHEEKGNVVMTLYQRK